MEVVEKTMPSRILITGVTGFVGRYLVEQCRSYYPEATLFGVYNREIPSPQLKRQMVPLHADLLRAEEINRALEQARPDIIFHMAAQSSVAISWSDPLRTLQVNGMGTLNLLEAVRYHYPHVRLVLPGSSEQYGLVAAEQNPISEQSPMQPRNPYAVSKMTQDLYAYQYYAAYGIPVLRARTFNLFGPYQSNTFVVSSFAYQIARIEAGLAEPTIKIGNLQARQDFLPVRDAASAYIAIAEKGEPGEVYNVGSAQPRSIREVLDCLLSYARVPIEVSEDPGRMRPLDMPLMVADVAHLTEHTGWQPQSSFEAAIEETLAYWRSTVIACSR